MPPTICKGQSRHQHKRVASPEQGSYSPASELKTPHVAEYRAGRRGSLIYNHDKGRDGRIRKDRRTSTCVFSHPDPPAPLKTERRADSHVGAAQMLSKSVPAGAHVVLPFTTSQNPNLFAVRVFGDSMLPEFREGDTAICDPKLKPHNGDFVIARRGDSILLRRYHTRHAGARLEALNDDYSPIPLLPAVARIVAVVIERSRTYRIIEPPAKSAVGMGGGR